MCLDSSLISNMPIQENGAHGRANQSSLADEDAKALRIRRVAGGCMIQLAPIFSHDGNLLFIIYETSIQAFSVTTGELVQNYGNTANESCLIGMVIDNTNPKLIYGCTIDGLIISWKIETGALCEKFNVVNNATFVAESLHILYDHDNKSSFLVLGKSSKRIFFHICPHSKKILNTITVKLHDNDARNETEIETRIVATAGGCGLNYFAFIAGKRWYWHKLSGTCTQSRPHCSNVQPVVIINHPTEAIVAIGDAIGRVILYRNFLEHNRPIPETYHWHTASVECLAFGTSGTHFYSGSQDRVLVKWMVGQEKIAGVIPRVSDTILHVVVGPENLNIALCTADNGITILDALLLKTAVVQSFSRITTKNVEACELFPAGLHVDPRTQAIVLNARTGCIQFFSTYTKSLIYTMDVTLRNYNTEENGVAMHNTDVTNIAINVRWIATVEHWTDHQHSMETRLKFWYRKLTKDVPQLYTNIENVHNGGVTDIVFSSPTKERDLQCATAGRDRCIKVWEVEEVEKSNGKINLVWYCVGKVHYRNLPVKSLSYSQDASLLAGGFGNVLCTWNSDTLQLKCTLSAPSSYDGCINRAVVMLPTCKEEQKMKKNKNHNDFYDDVRSKIIAEMIALANGNQEKCSLLKHVSNKYWQQRNRILCDGKMLSIYCPVNIVPNAHKKIAMQKVSESVQMGMVHKVELMHALNIGCKTNRETKTRIQKKFIISRRSTQQIYRRLHKLNENVHWNTRYRGIRKLRNFERRRLPTVTLDKLFRKVFSIPTEASPSFSKVNHGSRSKLDNTIQQKNKNPIKSYGQIQKVLFCFGQFSHLLVMCTENRMIVWNLLSLKIQVSALLTIDHIALDPFSNLIAVFTKDNEVYVFLPNIPMPLYHRTGMPKVYGAVWIPRRYPRSQSFNLDWQATSQLYFLNDKQELLHLVSDTDEELYGPAVSLSEPSIGPATPFGALLAKHSGSNSLQPFTGPFQPGMGLSSAAKSAMKDIISSSSHTMAPISLLCKDFLRSLFVTEDNRTKDNCSQSLGHRILAGTDSISPVADDDSDALVSANAKVYDNDGDEGETDGTIEARWKEKYLSRKAAHVEYNRTTQTIQDSNITAGDDAILRKLLDEPIDISFHT